MTHVRIYQSFHIGSIKPPEIFTVETNVDGVCGVWVRLDEEKMELLTTFENDVRTLDNTFRGGDTFDMLFVSTVDLDAGMVFVGYAVVTLSCIQHEKKSPVIVDYSAKIITATPQL